MPVSQEGSQYALLQATCPLQEFEPVQQITLAFAALVTFPAHDAPFVQSTRQLADALQVTSSPHALKPLQSTTHVLPLHVSLCVHDPPPSQSMAHVPASQVMSSSHALLPEQPTVQLVPPQLMVWVHDAPP
jgi:hypothetical protein